jgi:inorganic phosphate transporter, PiT family
MMFLAGMILRTMEIFGEHITTSTALLLLLALGLALTFEFVNGFHDTANAVATVIYTHSLKPTIAVVWSGLWNLAGVLHSNGAVAFGITALLPVELVLNVGSAAGFAMVFSLLISAIVWNLGTWYFGLPASSSHTLIGSIMGVGLANSLLAKGHIFGEGVNWAKASEVGLSLLVSPLVGFCAAAGLLLLTKAFIKRPELFKPPEGKEPPPVWIRGLLVLTCTGVSFAHGSNDGQKGMGLIMLILVGIVPGGFALNRAASHQEVTQIVSSARVVNETLEHWKGDVRGNASLVDTSAEAELSNFLKTTGVASDNTFVALANVNQTIVSRLDGKATLGDLSGVERGELRSDIYLASETINKMNKKGLLADLKGDKTKLLDYSKALDKTTKFIPDWVKIVVALALGLGTMIGWKRIVVTVGEKIGKEHLTYAQGASAELVAMTTIGAADMFGLPVSTTHVLSSGIAGTMAANRSGLQMDTLRNIALAWLLTLPVCVFLGATIFALSLNLILAIGTR